MARAAGLGVVAVLVAVLAVVPGRASLHSPDEPMAVPVRADGTPEPLPFDEFKRRLVQLTNELNPTLPTAERDRLLKRIEIRRAARNRSQTETVALAVDLLRAGRPDEAEAVLANDRRGFLPNTTLAHVHAARGEWAKAYEYQDIANDERPPAELPGLTKPQLDWQLKLNAGPLKKLFELRSDEARANPRTPPEDEELDRLFPAKFVNESGQYEPGAMAAAEKAKLPPDAIPAVQQLLLWFPGDTRLYWLLGELYAANGQLDEARKILDECVSEARQYGNRKALVAHRAAVRAAVETKEKAEEQKQIEAFPISLRTVVIYFAVVALVAVLAAVRVLSRRGKDGCGPVG